MASANGTAFLAWRSARNIIINPWTAAERRDAKEDSTTSTSCLNLTLVMVYFGKNFWNYTNSYIEAEKQA